MQGAEVTRAMLKSENTPVRGSTSDESASLTILANLVDMLKFIVGLTKRRTSPFVITNDDGIIAFLLSQKFSFLFLRESAYGGEAIPYLDCQDSTRQAAINQISNRLLGG